MCSWDTWGSDGFIHGEESGCAVVVPVGTAEQDTMLGIDALDDAGVRLNVEPKSGCSLDWLAATTLI